MAKPVITSREIRDTDLRELAELLGRGLGYETEFYLEILRRLERRPPVDGFPRYGYALLADGVLVGAIVLIFSRVQSSIRCHVTNWYVAAPYRTYATLFFAGALANKEVTYLNTSARPAVWPIIAAQGFIKYSHGQFVFPTLPSLFQPNAVKLVGADIVPTSHFEPFERELVLEHAEYGCICFWCVTPDRAYPFVFWRRRFRYVVPGAQLIYCHDIDDIRRFARAISSYLFSLGVLFVSIDSNGPITGLTGMYLNGKSPRWYKGPKPRLGDLAYTQTAMVPYHLARFRRLPLDGPAEP